MNFPSKLRGDGPFNQKWAFPLVSLLFVLAFIVVHDISAPIGGQQREITEVETKTTRTLSQYELAKTESLNFFDDVDTTMWERFKKRARNEPIYLNPSNPNNGSDSKPLWLLENVDPIFTCPNLQRVGGRGDGPKWTCDPHRLVEKPDCLVYSIGSKGIYLFEDAIISVLKENSPKPVSHGWLPNCEIHVFDPDPSYGRPHDPQKNNIHYHAWGLKSSYEEFNRGPFPKNFEFYSFQEIRQKLGHENRRIDIFKIDCESCEWSTYKDWLQPDVDIRQILIETHFLPKKPNQFFDRFFDHGYVLFSKEANTHPEARPFGVYFEWGFLRLSSNFLGRTPTISDKI
jgi:hypothetical protein